MKTMSLLLLILLLASCGTSIAPKLLAPDLGTVEVDSIRQDNPNDKTMNFVHVLFTYTNTTKRTFTWGVRVRAVAYDADGNRIGANVWNLIVGRACGIIKPGDEHTMECVLMATLGSKCKSAKCKVVVAK